MNNQYSTISIKAESIVSNIMMSSDKTKSFLLVEGYTDLHLFKKLLSCDHCKIHAVGEYKKISAKERVIKVLKILKSRGFESFFAIIDADFEHIEGIKYSSSNLFRTETYNTEGLMLKSEALENMLLKNADTHELTKFQLKTDIREKLLTSSKPIGIFRLISEREKLGIPFTDLDFNNLICKKTLEIDKDRLIDFLIVFITSRGSSTWRDFEIEEEYDKLSALLYNSWIICNGHDMIEILSIGLKSIFGKEGDNINSGLLESKLRKSYKLSHFKNTELYLNIVEWEEKNKPFKVLR